VPTSFHVIPPVIGRVGTPMNMLIAVMRIVPIGAVVCDRPVRAVGIQLVHPPAVAAVITGDVGTFSSLSARACRNHQGCSRNGEKRTHSKRNMKLSHEAPFFAAPSTAFSGAQ
jgi:hypothetical protein